LIGQRINGLAVTSSDREAIFHGFNSLLTSTALIIKLNMADISATGHKTDIKIRKIICLEIEAWHGGQHRRRKENPNLLQGGDKAGLAKKTASRAVCGG
jgi:hypothetical protein